jgi:outer membrane protein OmpA-like peptidoglycan-associated protein
MNKFYIFTISLLFLSFSATIQAQIAQLNPKIVTTKQYETKANEAFAKKDFNTALEYYMVILKDDTKREDLFWNTAESARQTRHYNIAYKYFETLNQSSLASNYPQLAYKRAMVKKNLGDYEGAVALLKTVTSSSQMSSVNNAGEALKEIQAEIEACEWAKPITESVAKYELVHLDDKVNSFYTDIAPVQYGNTLYYTSAYFEDDNKKPVTRVYMSDSKNKSLSAPINSTTEGDFTAHFALNTEGSRAYYTISKQLKTGDFKSEIYYREKGTDGTWNTPVRLPDTINTAAYTATQPTIGFDKAKGHDVLYFVSDRNGGKGGLDIWYADIDSKGNVGIPQNLSEINTIKDDITPFYFNKAQILFFSTEGYKSMGGFDVFYVNKTENNTWSTPINGGFPLNSSYDETYYSINGESVRSYFVSNRKGGQCASPDKDCVCNDIYYYDIKLDLKSETFLAGTNDALKGCQVDLIDVETGKVIKYFVNQDGNNFNFPLDLNKTYRLVATKEGYMPATVEFDTKNYWQTETIYKRLELRPNLKLNVLVFDAIDLTALNGAKFEMREVGSNKLILSEILKGNSFTTNKIEFGKSYWLYGYKDTYESDSSLLVIDAYGTSSRWEYSDSLYLKPFKGLPLTLYFHDDHPNPRTRDTTTSLTYGETYESYIRREAEYLKAYFGNNNSVSFSGANEISAFFRDSIKYNYNKLMEFMSLMNKYMVSGKSLEIVIEGYASPLAAADYNRNLTSRRISSLINQLYSYQNGILRPYILGKQLRIRVLPFGESRSKTDVSDNFNDQKNSIYNVKAMRERKVEIKEINQVSADDLKGLSYNLNDALKGYVDFDTHISFLDKNYPIAGSSGQSIVTAKGISKTSVNSVIPSSYSTVTKSGGVRTTAKQRHEFVLIDSYTGETITQKGYVEVDEYNVVKSSGKVRRKGDYFYSELQGDKNYMVKGRASGYSESSINYQGNTEGVEIVRDTLVLTPFMGLPLPLYFNNDRPNPNTKKSATSVPYDKSFKDYFGQKKDFIRQFNQILYKEGSVPSANNEMETFFENDVKQGFEKLSGYSTILKSYLQKGMHVEIILEGYASPLAQTDYNEYLTNRRINSVINFFSSNSGGSLAKYIKNGQLELIVKPLGESSSPSSVSDDASDPKRSIYSLGASKERRVEIKDILIRVQK